MVRVDLAVRRMNVLNQLNTLKTTVHGQLFSGVVFDARIGHKLSGLCCASFNETGRPIKTDFIVDSGMLSEVGYYVETVDRHRYLIGSVDKQVHPRGIAESMSGLERYLAFNEPYCAPRRWSRTEAPENAPSCQSVSDNNRIYQ